MSNHHAEADALDYGTRRGASRALTAAADELEKNRDQATTNGAVADWLQHRAEEAKQSR